LKKNIKLPRVLCVDDEVRVLHSIERSLRDKLDLTLVTSAADALTALRETPEPFQVIVSDMRMPDMNGINLLTQVRREFPDVVRALLTGHGDLEIVARAVNEGNIFRFLAKPCSMGEILDAVRACVRQHSLVSAERVLLEETLKGSIDAMSEILALSSPTLFGRGTRVKTLAELMCTEAGIHIDWQMQVAAQLSQIGRITLPDTIATKLATGEPLTAQESGMVERVPQVTYNIISHIPRLDEVLLTIQFMDKNFDGTGSPRGKISGDDIPIASRVLKLANRIEELQGRGYSVRRILDSLRVETGAYDPRLLKAYEAIADVAEDKAGPRGMLMHEMRIGMVMVEPVRSAAGVMLVAAGQEVSESLLRRIQNYHDTVGIVLPLWVRPAMVDDDEASDPALEHQLTN
jgi:response regulator RpfG family c-di-GMP phosphodiesterase